MDDKIIGYIVIGAIVILIIKWFIKNVKIAGEKAEISKDLSLLAMDKGINNDAAYDSLVYNYFLTILDRCNTKKDFDFYWDILTNKKNNFFTHESSYNVFMQDAKYLRKEKRKGLK